MEIDPNELAASMLVYKAKMERRYKQDLENRNDKEEGVVQTFQGVDLASIADPEVQLRDIKFPKNFKDLTRDRLAMNARLEPKKDPKNLAIEAKLKDRISLNMDKQPSQRGHHFLQNYTGLNIVLDPKALGEEGLTTASPVSLVVNSPAQDRAEADAQSAGADLQGRGRGDPDHQPAGRPGADLSQDLLRRRPGHAARIDEPQNHAARMILNPSRTGQTDPEPPGLPTQRAHGARSIRAAPVPATGSAPPRASGPRST